MPAIQPARLKVQAAELAQNAPDAEKFCRAFHAYLDYYADRTYRSGIVGEPPPLMRAYHVPLQVVRAVVKELAEHAADKRDESLALADMLWSEPYLEFRLLAASLLGQVSPNPPDSIFGRIDSWTGPGTEVRLINELIISGLERLRLEQPDRYIGHIEDWLKSKHKFENQLGLKAIPPLLDTPGFEDLPLIFRMLDQMMRSAQPSLRPEVLAVIESLALHSPKETMYFLHQTALSGRGNPNLTWYVRHSLKLFPSESQKYLQEALRRGR
jgi:hypothetical protein